MESDIPKQGEVSADLFQSIHDWWEDAGISVGLNLVGFDKNATLEKRIAWAIANGLSIGVVYSRYSTKRQDSTSDQVRTCVQAAVGKKIYCPPEYVCVDEGISGRSSQRDGLDRMRFIMKNCHATVLLVFSISRLFRQAFKGFQLIQEEIVEEGLRAISVSQEIDTNEKESWKLQIQVYNIVDSLQIEATAKHVYAGLKGLFLLGYTVGALAVGYRRKEVPDAPMTNRGGPRTEPEIDPEAAAMIREHFQLIHDGLPISQGWQKWVSDSGPVDPRCKTNRMSYSSYHRMLSRKAYIGLCEFGRKKNEFSTKRDYSRQIDRPEGEVVKLYIEKLAIVEEEVFYSVQKILNSLKRGPRGPRNKKEIHLWDILTEMFWCSECKERFYYAGSKGLGMRCKNGPLCPCHTIVKRKAATQAVCQSLAELIQADAGLLKETLIKSQELLSHDGDEVKKQICSLDRKLATLANKINDLFELAGSGTGSDRKETKAKIKLAQSARAMLTFEQKKLKNLQQSDLKVPSADKLQEILDDIVALLDDAANGRLKEEAVYKAKKIIQLLIVGHVRVVAEPRPGRKKSKNVSGHFKVNLLKGVQGLTGAIFDNNDETAEEQMVWLRKPPKLDLLAPRVHELIDIDGESFRSAAKRLIAEGHKMINSGVVYQMYDRYYEMVDKPKPDRPYNNGEQRKKK